MLVILFLMINFEFIISASINWNGEEIEIPEPFEFESVQEIMSYLGNNYWKDQDHPNYQRISSRNMEDDIEAKIRKSQSDMALVGVLRKSVILNFCNFFVIY